MYPINIWYMLHSEWGGSLVMTLPLTSYKGISAMRILGYFFIHQKIYFLDFSFSLCKFLQVDTFKQHCPPRIPGYLVYVLKFNKVQHCYAVLDSIVELLKTIKTVNLTKVEKHFWKHNHGKCSLDWWVLGGWMVATAI